MMTPSTMPIIINIKLNGVSTTAKPWNRRSVRPNASPGAVGALSVSEKTQWIENAFKQRHLEPHFEHQKKMTLMMKPTTMPFHHEYLPSQIMKIAI